MYVCIRVYFSGPGIYHRRHFYEKYISLKYHSHILPISARFFLLQESSSIWHLDVHPNLLFWAFCSEGNVLIRFCLFFCERKSHEGTDSMSHTPEFILWCEFVGHSIVFQSMCFVNFGKSKQLLILALYVYYFFMGGFAHIYFHIIFITLIVVFVIAASSGGVLDWTGRS
jgi:hypothetical protein